LKEKGVECYFEKESIWTFDGKGELLITIMSSLAQEESRSISENCTWGQRKRFADGKVCVPYSRFLGYDKGENGVLKLNEEEAVLVRRIYSMFIEGATPHTIAKILTEEGIPSPAGKATWSSTTIRAILSNEKYKGDALLQKSYTIDFLSKKKKINEGEIPQYYVENAHQAIIEPAVFEMVQQEIQKRKKGANRHSGKGMYASHIKCGECGLWYGSKVWHSNSKYRRTIYQCNGKFKNAMKCSTPHLDEETIKRLFISAVNKLLTKKAVIINDFELIKQALFDTASLEAERVELQNEITVVVELTQKGVEENARVAIDQTDYQQRYAGLTERYDKAKTRLDEVVGEISDKKARCEAVEVFIAELGKQDGIITEFDERLWHSLLDYLTVYKDDGGRFTFRNGTIIKA